MFLRYFALGQSSPSVQFNLRLVIKMKNLNPVAIIIIIFLWGNKYDEVIRNCKIKTMIIIIITITITVTIITVRTKTITITITLSILAIIPILTILTIKMMVTTTTIK